MKNVSSIAAATVCLALVYHISCSRTTDHTSWEARGGGDASIRYSSLSQIDTSNVDELQVAWTYRSGDADTARNSQIQCNPIIVDGTLYATSPRLKLLALDAETGEERWVFNPFPDTAEINHGLNNIRGVTWWQDENDKRILFAAGPRLYAVNAESGRPVESFGENGSVSLGTGLGERSDELFVTATSPGIIYNDLLILGSRVSEGADAAPGHIRAFNARTGEVEWIFRTIPRPGDPGYETWQDPDAWKRIGGANSWAGMSLDRERGLLFVPTGSASPDFYGGNRKGANLFANSLLALRAGSGELAWHYQTVHHDLWDRDLPSPPSLVTVEREGRTVDAVAQTTKTGFLYLFNRESGEPLFTVREDSVPVDSDLEGEEVWPTQPAPLVPEPFHRQRMGPEDINPYTSDENRAYLRGRLEQLDSDHMYAPPSSNGMLMFPGFDGGAEWGGNAFDPSTGILYVNSNEVPWILRMVPTRPEEMDDTEDVHSNLSGRILYRTHCMSCHGTDRQGSGDIPGLLNVDSSYSPDEILELIDSGRRMMPGFRYLSNREKKTIVNYLLGEAHYDTDEAESRQEGDDRAEAPSPYVMTGYEKFRTPEGYPANTPPWGTLNAINLNTGEYEWRIPLGEYQSLGERGIPATGTENYGGPVVTAGGLVFIAATLDEKIRAFDKRTGELLWEAKLPAAGYATPAVYEAGGRQFVVIACGGGKLGTKSGDAYVAFALP